MTIKRKRMYLFILAIIVCCLLVYKIDWQHLLIIVSHYPAGLKEITMILLQALQIVIAFLPGEPLELFSGYMFGSWWGTVICLLGSLLGTIIVYGLVKKYGYQIIRFFFKEEKINEFKQILEKKRNKYLLYGLYCIPGSPKDIMTYMMCLFDLSLFKWLIFTTLARIPSIVTSTFLAGTIKNQQYDLAIMIFLVTIILVMIAIIYYRKVKTK